MNNKKIVRIAVPAVALTLGGWGCLSMQSQTSLDATNAKGLGSNQPYVEAYVEYAGPQLKWSGPSSFILHVTAKDGGPAQITTTPALLVPPHRADAEPELSPKRVPATSSLSKAVGAHAVPENGSGQGRLMSSEDARAQLAQMSGALQGVQAPFHGCMSPVRVRLIRADGGILERQGCRSEMGWSRAVSDSVSMFVEASLNRAPAAVTSVVAPSVPTQVSDSAHAPAVAESPEHPVSKAVQVPEHKSGHDHH